MKHFIALTTLLLAATLLHAQQSKETKRIVLSPKSTISTAEIAEGFAKYCPNVSITENAEKADYILEAASTTKTSSSGTTNCSQYNQTITCSGGGVSTSTLWHFTLLNKDGDVLMTTHPQLNFWQSVHKHHFESVCKFINNGKGR